MAPANTADQSTSPPAESSDAARALAPLVEHLRDGCIFVDYDMCVGFLNAVARRDIRTRGDDPDRYPGQSLWDVLHYASNTAPRLAVEQAARDRIPSYFTTRGTYGAYWVEVDVVPLDEGCLLYYRDATPRSAAEEARVASESELQMTSERLRALIDDAPLAVIVIDADARVQHWNPAAETMFQWTAEEVVGKPLPNVPAEERASFDANMVGARAGGTLKAHAARRLRKDGVILDVQMSSSPMRDRVGAIDGAIVMVSDVTAQRKLETQLRMAQKMEAVGLLAGGVAHDFNNLLTAIKGFASLLQMTLDEDEQSTEFLGEINKAADRAAGLTAQLLAFSRRQLLRPEPLDLNTRISDLERMLRVLLRDDGQLVLELDPDLSMVLADPGQVEQVILNLIVNARDAIRGHENGRVTIRTSNAELRDEFEHWGVQDASGAYVRLDVSDNGSGMDRATQARIFDPFFTTKEAGQGTGLGLATVFGIVKQSGGYVWVESEVGEGATFSIYLPRTNSGGRLSGAVNVVAGAGSERILLVEDEDAVRRVARRALELHGYQIIEASDGSAALKLADENQFDLLLTDVMMPGMLGPALAAEVRRLHPDLPVLFMSGHSDEIVRDGLLDPATPFLPKPFTPAQLAQKVRDALDLAQSRKG
jgi:two-component system cell cycle sensor histidine kinase/response regulator CckA